MTLMKAHSVMTVMRHGDRLQLKHATSYAFILPDDDRDEVRGMMIFCR